MSQLAEPPPADDEIRFVALQRCSCRLAPLTRVTACRASPALKAEAGVDGDEPPLPRRPPSGDGEHNTVDLENCGSCCSCRFLCGTGRAREREEEKFTFA
jgi:NAD-dependent dihydropyrimidine dehydrogenase PreA subunit